jgi:hypothetical protein
MSTQQDGFHTEQQRLSARDFCIGKGGREAAPVNREADWKKFNLEAPFFHFVTFKTSRVIE